MSWAASAGLPAFRSSPASGSRDVAYTGLAGPVRLRAKATHWRYTFSASASLSRASRQAANPYMNASRSRRPAGSRPASRQLVERFRRAGRARTTTRCVVVRVRGLLMRGPGGDVGFGVKGDQGDQGDQCARLSALPVPAHTPRQTRAQTYK